MDWGGMNGDGMGVRWGHLGWGGNGRGCTGIGTNWDELGWNEPGWAGGEMGMN